MKYALMISSDRVFVARADASVNKPLYSTHWSGFSGFLMKAAQ